MDPETGLIDYEALAKNAIMFKPKMIVAGVSCYARNLDYAKFRKIADDCGALLMADMAHVAGLVAAGLVPNPFDYCDVVTSTVHKTLRGPRAGIIFFRKGKKIVKMKGAIHVEIFHCVIMYLKYIGRNGTIGVTTSFWGNFKTA